MPVGKEAVTMTNHHGAHLYSANGVTYPSVTTVLDIVAYNSHLMGWSNYLGFKKIRYEDELNRAANRGTYVHAFNQCYVDPANGIFPRIQNPALESDVRNRSNNFLYELRKAKGNWKTIFTETPFLSDTYQIGGTVDWYAEWYGKKTLFDFKTSSGLREKHVIQIGGYYYGLTDNGLQVDQGCIIICREDRCYFYFVDLDRLKRFGDVFFQIYDYYKSHEWVQQQISQLTKPIIPTTR